ncbi:MAG TPA: glycosyltransferase family 2 protein [Nevskiaceae bacterium]|nr:glycosyltransferase family 2 protein [Nevskiaceae bacterium]
MHRPKFIPKGPHRTHDYARPVMYRKHSRRPIKRTNYKDMPTTAPIAAPKRKATLALLIAAHNEEVVLAKTINSAIAAGMTPEHIYVVDDNSSDRTSAIARSILPRQNVCKVRRSGKGLALTKASKKYHLPERYRWIHIADADGAFSPNYFPTFRKNLRVENAAATGYVRSLPGKNVSQYRVFEYTVGMELHRRFQSIFNIIPVIPGPTSCFRSDVFARVNFANKSLTEDFDVTLQIHRQKLGKIQFIPKAITYTQDPGTVKDFTKQITRWNRGVMQGITRHRIGRKVSPIDAYLSYQVLQNLLFFVNYFLWVPYLTMKHHSANILASIFVYDVLVTLGISVLVAARSRRWDILSAFPIVYALRWFGMVVFLRAFAEVVILRKFRVSEGHWENNAGRRYALPV